MKNWGYVPDDQCVLGACGNTGRPGNLSWGHYPWAWAFNTMSCCSLGMDVYLILDSDMLFQEKQFVSLCEVSELTLRKSLAPRHRS